MSFYLVTNPDTNTAVWLAWEDLNNARIYAWVANLSAFVRHDSLALDFYWDTELSYRPVDAGEAVQIIEAGTVGKLDARTHQAGTLERLSAVDDRKTPAELLVAMHADDQHLSPPDTPHPWQRAEGAPPG